MPALTFDLLRSELDLSGEENRAWGRCWEAKGSARPSSIPSGLCSLLWAVAVTVPCPGMFPPSPQSRDPHGEPSGQRAQSAARMLSLFWVCVGIPFPGIKQPLCRACY